MPKTQQQKLRAREAKNVALSCFQYIILNLYNVRAKSRGEEQFRSPLPLPFLGEVDADKLTPDAISDLFRLPRIFDVDNGQRRELCQLASNMVAQETSVADTMNNLRRIFLEHRRLISNWSPQNTHHNGIVPQPPSSRSDIKVKVAAKSNCLEVQWPCDLGENVITAALRLQSKLRREQLQPTEDEYFFTHLAYREMVQHGSDSSVLLREARPLGTPGFRDEAQTYIALTDPGEGHVLGTARFTDWLKGVTVHVEHVERPKDLSREHCETYRCPSLSDFSRVRLHIGGDAPTTIYIGRPVRDCGDFEHDLLKTTNLTSAAVSEAFGRGAAECKLSMEGLTLHQALRYMRSVRCSVRRSGWQVLSAAWNLNQTWVDDIDDMGHHTANSVDRNGKDVAEKAVITTARGGFEKVTFDGASDTYPSTSLLPDQLSELEALCIVHVAHEHGLLTYFSAGFKFHNIPYAVRTGVDGIGIGGAGILRYMDKDTGFHGPYTEENITRILSTRDREERTLKGRAALLLARLDTMYDEGSISPEEDTLRQNLFSALIVSNAPDEMISKVCDQLVRVSSLPSEGVMPHVFRAKRLLEAKDPVLREYCAKAEEWTELTAELGQLVRHHDEESLMKEYDSGLWHTLRLRYHAGRPGINLGSSARQSMYAVKT